MKTPAHATALRRPHLVAILTVIAVIAALFAGTGPLSAAPAQALGPVTYYVDSALGSDTNTGTTTSAPWKSLAKVNATVLQPGDTVAFKRGSTWTGELLPKGSGTPGSPITITNYGSGALPAIKGQGLVSAAVRVSNQHDITIDGLDVSNTAGAAMTTTTPQRIGIHVHAKDAGTLANITIQNNSIHDIDARTGGCYPTSPAAGGVIYTVRGNTTPTRFDNLVIQDNVITRSHSVGIAGFSTWMQRDGWNSLWDCLEVPSTEWSPFYPSTGMIIRGNHISEISGGGIIPLCLSGALVEHNRVHRTALKRGNVAIWWSNTDSMTVQYNEVSETHIPAGDWDGTAFDADQSTYGSLVQYNYSHDNHGGFFMAMSAYQGGTEAVVRYNVSENDGQGAGNVGIFKFYNLGKRVEVYNNTIYRAPGPNDATAKMVWLSSSNVKELTFTNNIFANEANLPYVNNAGAAAVTFSGNLYYPGQPRPTDAQAVVGDAQLAAPGTATDVNELDAYELGAGSAAAGAGLVVPAAGTVDVLGRGVPSVSPNIGALQTPATAPTVTSSFATGLGTQLSALVDGKPATPWATPAGVTFPGTIQIDYPTVQTFESLKFAVTYGRGQGPKNVTVQTWNGSSWVTQVSGASIVWGSNSASVEHRSVDLPKRVSTTKVRITVNAANTQWGNFGLTEISLSSYPLSLASASIAALASTGPGGLVDGSLKQGWSSPASGYAFPFNLDVTTRSARLISSVTLSTAYGQGQGITDVSVQTWDGANWVTRLSHVPIAWASNSATVETRTLNLPSTVSTTAVRLVVHNGNRQWGNVAVNELGFG